MPGNTTSGSTTCESVGQNSGLFFHSVPNRSKQAPLRISQTPPFDLTIVVHFGHRVCITCFPGASRVWIAPPLASQTTAGQRPAEADAKLVATPLRRRGSPLGDAAYSRLTSN